MQRVYVAKYLVPQTVAVTAEKAEDVAKLIGPRIHAQGGKLLSIEPVIEQPPAQPPEGEAA